MSRPRRSSTPARAYIWRESMQLSGVLTLRGEARGMTPSVNGSHEVGHPRPFRLQRGSG